MSEEIELASKAIVESMDVLVERSGLLGPVKELSDWVTSFIHYRRQPALARVVTQAAEKIQQAGLPVAAVSDRLLRELLEGGSIEDDEAMQELWANLLANAMTEGSPTVRRAFPRILRDLEPSDVATLERISAEPEPQYRRGGAIFTDPIDDLALENLSRHELVENYTTPVMEEAR